MNDAGDYVVPSGSQHHSLLRRPRGQSTISLLNVRVQSLMIPALGLVLLLLIETPFLPAEISHAAEAESAHEFWPGWWKITQHRYEPMFQQLVWPYLLKSLTAEQKVTAGKVIVRFDPTLDPRTSGVRKINGGYEISLSLTALTVLSWLNDDQVFEELFTSDEDKTWYLQFIGKQLTDYVNRLDAHKSESGNELLPLPMVSDVPVDTYLRWMRQDNARTQVVFRDGSALWFILAHELGHVMLGQLDRDMPKSHDQIRQLEYEADRWAVEQMVKSGMDPVAAGWYLMTFLDYEHDLPVDDRTHEISACRAWRLMLFAKEQLAHHAGIETNVSGPLTAAERSRIIKELKSLEQETEHVLGCKMNEISEY